MSWMAGLGGAGVHITHDMLGTIPGWITSAGVIALLGLFLRYRLGARKLDLESAVIHDSSEAAIRDHYAKEVSRLTQRLESQSKAFREDLLGMEKTYRDMLNDAEERHNACIEDRDKLRERVYELETEWRGMIRVITQASIDKVLMLPGELPDDIKEAAARVELLIREKGRD